MRAGLRVGSNIRHLCTVNIKCVFIVINVSNNIRPPFNDNHYACESALEISKRTCYTPSMELKRTQEYCLSDGEMTLVRVPSKTEPGKTYEVLVQDINSPFENICECKGYEYRGHCVHQIEAQFYVCGWEEQYDVEQQTPLQKEQHICPRCGGPTESETIDVEA